MNITMDDSRLTTVTTQGFLKKTHKEKYSCIDKTVDRLGYHALKKKDKKVVVNYLRKITGYKHTQLFRLINRAEKGNLKRVPYHRIHPHRIYTSRDIKLLEKTGELHLRLSDMATKEILRREYTLFGHREFQTIAGVSHSHIDNLRDAPIYKNS